MRFLICLLAIATLLPSSLVAANSSADLEARRKALNDLLHEQWEYTPIPMLLVDTFHAAHESFFGNAP